MRTGLTQIEPVLLDWAFNCSEENKAKINMENKVNFIMNIYPPVCIQLDQLT